MAQQQLPQQELWADKYKPKSISDMCYPVAAQRLKGWLQTWHPNNPQQMKGALLSGPPGVGKTTSVYMVAKELSVSVVEYNASDHRSKKTLKDNVHHIINNRLLSAPPASTSPPLSRASNFSFILLMDEVDGCDMGGVGEVIQMIKATQVPILCTCNDRWHQKLKSLVNHVEDVRFIRPPCNIVATYVCDKILAREGVSLPKAVLQEVIKKEGSDIRSILGNLQFWTLNRKVLDQNTLVGCAKSSEKNGDIGIFDAAETFLLSRSDEPPKTFEQLQTAFYSADLVDLFIQENYLHFCPPGRDWMGSVATAAEMISMADRVQKAIYTDQTWALSNTHLLLSAVAPCATVRGRYESFAVGQAAHFDRQRPIKFPSWLGNNSTRNKNLRLLACLVKESSKTLSGNGTDVVMDYLPLGVAPATSQALAEKGKDGIEEVVSFMDLYGLHRDDWDFAQEVVRFNKMSAAPSRHYFATAIPTAAKSAFTREFNKGHKMETVAKGGISFSAPATTQDAEGAAPKEEGGTGEEEDEEERALLVGDGSSEKKGNKPSGGAQAAKKKADSAVVDKAAKTRGGGRGRGGGAAGSKRKREENERTTLTFIE